MVDIYSNFLNDTYDNFETLYSSNITYRHDKLYFLTIQFEFQFYSVSLIQVKWLSIEFYLDLKRLCFFSVATL